MIVGPSEKLMVPITPSHPSPRQFQRHSDKDSAGRALSIKQVLLSWRLYISDALNSVATRLQQ
jgi:hypothetical protein